MRICLIGKYPPLQGGTSVSTYWAAKELADRGHAVHVITNGNEAPFGYRCFGLSEERPDQEMRIYVHRTTPLEVGHRYIPDPDPIN